MKVVFDSKERTMNIKAIAIDMDGTMLDDGKTISDYNRSMIETIKPFIHVILSSARGMGSLHPYIDQLGLDGNAQYTVAYNGGYIIDGNGQLLDHHPIDLNHAKALIDFLVNTTSSLEITIYTSDQIIPIHTVDDLSNFLDHHPIYKIGAIGDKSEVDRVRALIPDPFNQVLSITSDKVSIECVAQGLSKAKGLQLVLDRLGLTNAQLCAIGDAENDIQMLDMAGYGIAMGNADAILLPHADYVSDDNNHDGVGKAIQYLIDTKRIVLSD